MNGGMNKRSHEEIVDKLIQIMNDLEVSDSDVTDVTLAIELRGRSNELFEIIETLRAEWGIIDTDAIEECALDMLYKITTSDYAKKILSEFLPDIIEDVTVSASQNWSEIDVRLAIGRILCKKLGLDF